MTLNYMNMYTVHFHIISLLLLLHISCIGYANKLPSSKIMGWKVFCGHSDSSTVIIATSMCCCYNHSIHATNNVMGGYNEIEIMSYKVTGANSC